MGADVARTTSDEDGHTPIFASGSRAWDFDLRSIKRFALRVYWDHGDMKLCYVDEFGTDRQSPVVVIGEGEGLTAFGSRTIR